MNRICFSHDYPKLHGQTTAQLLAVKPLTVDRNTDADLLEYDTHFYQPRGGVGGQESDIAVQAKEIVRLKELSIKYLAAATGQSEKTVAKDMERDFFMSAQDALKYGVIDQVMEARK